ncbi:MAG: glutamate--cysteine ligase [Woeseiaceae bacterium]
MNQLVKDRINRLAERGSKSIISGGRKGVEKESLRVFPDGQLADSAHPLALGSALTNSYITTDFSEALLEFVTPAYANTWETLRVLCEIHQFTYDRLDDELLWVTSMPCLMADDDGIPLAQYGSSNVGRMKTVYRNGLGYRYGRRMQTIAGVHFNYSLPDAFWAEFSDLEESAQDPDEFRSAAYMGLVRNFRRFGWLILYLFGASPALCKSFLGGQQTNLEDFNDTTYFRPFATSLRMSDLGYSNNSQAQLKISLNSVDEYIDDLTRAICRTEPEFKKIGIKVDGEYRQLRASQLQIENEFYSPIRPKRVARSGERPTAALRRGGVEYVEVRSLDLNVFDPVGLNQNAMRFSEAFLIYCLLHESPPLDDSAYAEVQHNHGVTATEGRDPDLNLMRDGSEVLLRDWAREIIGDVRAIAEVIDRGEGGDAYVQAVDAQLALVDDAELTPSARVIQDMRDNGTGFYHFAMEQARGHKAYFQSLASLEAERLQVYTNEAADSIEKQKQIEQSDEISFDEYLEKYYSEQGCAD